MDIRLLRGLRWTALYACVAGLVACWVVTWSWGTWASAPSPSMVAIELALFGAASLLVLALALFGARPLAFPFAVLLLLYGWLGTWAYGFLWVPGAVAVLAGFLPRGGRQSRSLGASTSVA